LFAARQTTLALLLLALIAALFAACGESPGAAPTQARGEFTSTKGIADPELRRLRQDGNRLLDGGPDAFRRRLKELRGSPVVVNQWASWCGPCRFEFPFFQRQAMKHGARVAFLGVDSRDSREPALEFMQELPTPFPHYFDPEASIARIFRGGRAWPTTGFYSADGKLVFTHMGAYESEQQLEDEIRKYAFDG
jgi:cytochrome c biogenesis protein CcmG/thiol:disulfide interchange protein DsbE